MLFPVCCSMWMVLKRAWFWCWDGNTDFEVDITSGLRGHSLKLFKPRCRTTTRQNFFSLRKKSKAEHLYSALHGIQTTLKRSGMDHTAFNLQRTRCQPLPRKRSPDGAATECGGRHLIAAQYSFIHPERSWPGWLTYSGRLTHISGHPSATGRAQDCERTLARDWRSTAEPRGPTKAVGCLDNKLDSVRRFTDRLYLYISLVHPGAQPRFRFGYLCIYYKNRTRSTNVKDDME